MWLVFAPRTLPGKWALGLIGAFFIFMVIFWAVVASGVRGGDTFFSNPALAIPISLAGVSGIAAFVSGLYGIIRRRERSLLVFLASLIGLFVLIFALGEVITPH